MLIEKLHNIKVQPLWRAGKLISIKVKYNYDIKIQNYKHYIIFHDSLSILLTSLKNLSNTFLAGSPEFKKLENREIIDSLVSEYTRRRMLAIESNKITTDSVSKFLSYITDYCIRDCICLSHILFKFGNMVNDKWKINFHTYPTISSNAIAIYLTHYLKHEDLIPRVTGKIYRDIVKAYHGGHTDVYVMYSDKEVHSYDYTSMYPAMMLKHEMPVGKIDKFEGNPLKTGETFKSLCNRHAFIKCTVEVDKSLNRPVYMTTVKMDGELRSICATGTFLNQWVYLKEICKYYELTNGKIRIDPNSIKKGGLIIPIGSEITYSSKIISHIYSNLNNQY